MNSQGYTLHLKSSFNRRTFGLLACVFTEHCSDDAQDLSFFKTQLVGWLVSKFALLSIWKEQLCQFGATRAAGHVPLFACLNIHKHALHRPKIPKKSVSESHSHRTVFGILGYFCWKMIFFHFRLRCQKKQNLEEHIPRRSSLKNMLHSKGIASKEKNVKVLKIKESMLVNIWT